MNPAKNMHINFLIIRFFLIFFLAELPFFSVLGVEHAFANAEPQGHSHSDFDLCDWLKIQTTGSLTFHIDLVSPGVYSPSDHVLQARIIFDKQSSISASPPRAPPLP